ncbi:predicted protein [Scheffersomyces stipitis CBS 6054]|uniref:Uncharacterized protein n=1 Tax=Scheffersomyces stipitis (strain ATCC 58785 / CBS 6054 / NBRC 10063 / NRRL Y-11545) TaxID=322104 RepID=A3GHE3_PICST|nr:predicted protein [Scheffersomyces stipitis CBS 6054]EAZ62805.2 predicted protein [Scheffersomyces stipitis CBS 6054]
MYFSQLYTIFLCLCIFHRASAAPQKVLKPTEDSFYDAPKGFEDAEIGTILKIRKTPHMLRSVYIPINVQNSWQILVRSESAEGNATAIVTTVIEPYNADPSKLVSYQVAEDSSSENCAVSYSLEFGASMDTIIAQVEMYFMQAALEQGYYVVTPDYEGPQASFTAGRQAGHAVLDSIRATLASSNVTGVDPDAEVVMWGYSGGSLASGWAAALQPKYAPELEGQILGAALGGFVTNITLTAVSVDDNIFAGLIASAINGLMNEYPEFSELAKDMIRPERLENFLKADSYCMVPSLIHYAFDNFFVGNDSYFTQGLDVFKIPFVQDMINSNTLALKNNTEIPQIPLFIYHGELDEIVPFSGSQRAYTNWCEWGIESLEFSTAMLSGHITEFFMGAPAALTWVIERFEGKQPVKGCQKTQRLTNLDYPGTPEALQIYFQAAYESVFQMDVGPNGENFTKSDLQRLAKRSFNGFTPIDTSNLKKR